MWTSARLWRGDPLLPPALQNSSTPPGERYGSFISLLSPVTIPQFVAVNENVFSVNLPGKTTD
jgi:hypothetical protein